MELKWGVFHYLDQVYVHTTTNFPQKYNKMSKIYPNTPIQRHVHMCAHIAPPPPPPPEIVP